MKPDNKLGKLQFEPEQAFENLREVGQKVLAVPKKEVDRLIAKEKRLRARKRRDKS